MSSKPKLIASALAISAAGLSFIASNEGIVTTADGKYATVYLDPVGIPTVCNGHTGKDLRVNTEVPIAVCDRLLATDTETAVKAVQRLVRVPITQAQFDSLVDFTFNVGASAFAKSTLLKKVNAKDCRGAGAEFLRWKYASGKELRGLVIRREQESALWMSGC